MLVFEKKKKAVMTRLRRLSLFISPATVFFQAHISNFRLCKRRRKEKKKKEKRRGKKGKKKEKIISLNKIYL